MTTISIGLLAGLGVPVMCIACLLAGVRMGLHMAVDNTHTRGYFKAYGKKWRASEVRYVPEEP